MWWSSGRGILHLYYAYLPPDEFSSSSSLRDSRDTIPTHKNKEGDFEIDAEGGAPNTGGGSSCFWLLPFSLSSQVGCSSAHPMESPCAHP